MHKQQVSAFMLKHGRHYPRKKAWSMRYLRWLQEQQFDHPAHQIVLQEMVEAVRLAKERVERLERTIEEFLPAWSLAPIVGALRALRGVDLIVAATFVSEVGDIGRFDNPRQLMSYLGLVPSERSTGDSVRRGGITKAGNRRVRHMLVESAWTYRHSTTAWRAQALHPGEAAGQDPRDRLEGTDAADRPLSSAGWTWQADDGGLHGHCPGARRLHVVGCHEVEVRSADLRRDGTYEPSRMGGDGTAAGERPTDAWWPAKIRRRPT